MINIGLESFHNSTETWAMGKCLAGYLLTVMLSGCMAETVEQVVVRDGSRSFKILRGGAPHGWSVDCLQSGDQQWSLMENGHHIESIVISSTGEVTDAWYEGENYYMVMRHFEPGEPIGSKSIAMLNEVKAEARHRQIKFPQPVTRSFPSPAMAKTIARADTTMP